MFDIIFSPLKTIEAEKKKKNMSTTMVRLALASLFLGIVALIVVLKMGLGWGAAIGALFGFAIAAFLGNLFNAWIYKIAINTISGKGTYFDTLTALTNSYFIMTAGLVVATLLWLIPQLGFVLAVILLIIIMVLAYSVLIRTLTALSGADLLAVVVGLGVVFLASIMAVYLVIMLTTLSLGVTNPGALAIATA